jgi:WhiB family redox-sensing transcriptional regulator
MVDPPQAWTLRAACRGATSALFFSGFTSESLYRRLAREREAKRLCDSCEVRAECLDDAIAHHEGYGIWGGLNEAERRAARTIWPNPIDEGQPGT